MAKNEHRERAKLLFKLADLVEKHADEMVNSRPWTTASDQRSRYIDVPQTIETFRYYAAGQQS